MRCFVIWLVLFAPPPYLARQAPPPQSPSRTGSPAFSEFRRRVDEYLKLQKSVPRLRPTKNRQELVERRNGLAEKIRELRSGAAVGDIFAPPVNEEFRRVIRSTFRGPGAPKVRKTVRQGEPVSGWRLSVNGTYPDDLPLTTVPPTLLLRLPQLPAEVAYRIIGHDFVLEDTEARLIVDYIAGCVP